jgi:uncharacterized OsmC-like protein
MTSTNAPLAEIIGATRAAVLADPSTAQVAFHADHALVGPTEVAVLVGSGHAFKVDEPKGLGGGDLAATPVEYALAALGSCQAITYRFWAAYLGIKLETVEIKVEGDLDLRGFFGVDDQVRPGFGAVRVKVALGGPEPIARYQELAEAVDRHCPVLDIFRNKVPVERSVEAAQRSTAQVKAA